MARERGYVLNVLLVRLRSSYLRHSYWDGEGGKWDRGRWECMYELRVRSIMLCSLSILALGKGNGSGIQPTGLRVGKRKDLEAK